MRALRPSICIDWGLTIQKDDIPGVKSSKMDAPSKGEFNVADRSCNTKIFVGDIILNACFRIHFQLDGLYWWS